MPELIVDSRFETIARVAQGGMGTIYKATDRQTGGIVALKVAKLDRPDDIARFAREAALLATVHHANIVDYVAHGEAGGVHYLAQEWVEGPNLARMLATTGITSREAIEICAAVASALEAIHALGVIHRDVKPANIIVPAELDKTKLVDFGLARLASSAGVLTRAGTLVGTPSYMAPEQARGDTQIEPAADVWALGCVLHEALTGTVGFRGPTPGAVRAKILLGELPPLPPACPEAPPQIATLLFEMTRKIPSMRPPSAEVATRLRALPSIALGPKRKVVAATSAPTLTSVLPAKPGASVYMMASLGDTAGPEAVARMRAIADVHQLEVHMLDPASALLVSTAGGKSGALEATRAAFDLKREIWDSAVCVFAQPVAGAFEPAIDHGAALNEQVGVAAAFSEDGETLEIAIDDVIADLVGDVLDVAQSATGPVAKLRS